MKNAIRFALSKDEPFDTILERLQTYIETPATNISELKRKSTKAKGDIFEVFCKLYLRAKFDWYKNVWLLREIPADILAKLSLKKHDLGIDIVVEDIHGNYYAVQCKYRKAPRKKKNVLSWKQLSTFYSLCLRAGPFIKYIIFTNAEYVRREGRKDNDKDLTIAIGTLRSTSRDVWAKIIGDTGYRLDSIKEDRGHEEIKEVIKLVPEIQVKISENITRSDLDTNLEIKQNINIRDLRSNFLSKLK